MSKISIQSFAAVWFGLAAWLPAYSIHHRITADAMYISWGWGQSPTTNVIAFEVLPIVCAAIWGYRVGWRILHDDRMTIYRVLICSTEVVVWSYIQYGAIFAVWYGLGERDPNHTFTAAIMRALGGVVVGLCGVFLLVPIVFLWMYPLLLIVGMSAGVILYGIRKVCTEVVD